MSVYSGLNKLLEKENIELRKRLGGLQKGVSDEIQNKINEIGV